MDANNSTTFVWIVKNGATAYYPSTFQVDGATITVKWQNNVTPTAGNINSNDMYTYNIIKTATSTYTVFGSQTRFGS